MLRSTSVKNDIWKPVKLLARQSIKGPIINSSCNFRGDVVAVLTASGFSIFNNRELLDFISLSGGKKLYAAEKAAPYIHPRLASSTSRIGSDEPIEIKVEWQKS